jgi:hypothetical protein
MKVEDGRQFNETIASKVRCWVKIYYKILEHRQISRDHMIAID